MATTDDLKDAFAGESQANRRYLAFAGQAEEDGYPQIAKLFRAAAEAETVHAMAHLRAMDGVKSSAENLQAAISGEAYEFDKMYPAFVADAQKEGHKAGLTSFRRAMAVEAVHHELFSQAMKALQSGKDLSGERILVCPVCGNTVLGEAPDVCPICGTPGDRFVEVK